jgi:hypothetical protein
MNIVRDRQDSMRRHPSNHQPREDPNGLPHRPTSATLLLLALEYLTSESTFRQWLQDSYPNQAYLLQTGERKLD